MNIVDQAARIIRPDAFCALWEPHSELDEKRQAYQQAEARNKATQVLKLALGTKDLAKQLCDDEIEGWRWLGLPMENARLRAEVKKKYAEKGGGK